MSKQLLIENKRYKHKIQWYIDNCERLEKKYFENIWNEKYNK